MAAVIDAPATSEREVQHSYWKEHSQEPTVEAMMLDSKASEIDQMERPEVLSTLGCIKGKRVLELGAGIGRFTGEIAKTAASVLACDFMDNSIEENRRRNGHLPNCDFRVADVTQLSFPPGSFDVVFSNWLLMYLSDEEVSQLVKNSLSWLAEGGVLFFRESCFRRSGDKARGGFNPTHYRNPRQYFAIVDDAEVHPAEGGIIHFELDLCKCVDTYVAVKRNQNQICWRWRKVSRSSPRAPLFRTFLDQQQYSRESIARYEAVFGDGYISTGGEATTREMVKSLGLKPGQRVLDVGCGIGGGDFYMADTFGVHVHAMDLSVNAIMLALERAAARAGPGSPGGGAGNGGDANGGEANGDHANGGHANGADANGADASGTKDTNGHAPKELAKALRKALPSGMFGGQQQPHDVTFEVSDALTRDFPPASFDAVYSRDTLLHVHDKAAMFSRIFTWLKPGGKLLITDYARSDTEPSPAFAAYIKQRGYDLRTVAAYGQLLQAAGFSDVAAEDRTEQFLDCLDTELARVEGDKASFVARFGASGYAAVVDGWRDKVHRARAGEQRWGLFTATKPSA